jgi:5'-3' exonuclease
MEADDLMSVYQYERVKQGHLDTIICSRDKDLRITPGMHFGWPCGKQLQFGPSRVTDMGELELKGGKKLVGAGLKFFYSQVLTGDAVDNYPGLPGCGPVAAHKSLHDCETEAELFERVAGLYQKKCGDTWREDMLEQCRLAWMVRELDEEGYPVQYVMYDERGD